MIGRRAVLGGGLGVVAVAIGGCSAIPVIPGRPEPDAASALGWVRHAAGRFTLVLPRAEMGQNAATALKQIACDELGAPWDAVDVELHDTAAIAPVRATVGSDTIKDYAEPLAVACRTLRARVGGGGAAPGLVGASPPLVQGREIVTGAPLYAADVRLPRMAFGRVLRAPAPPDAPTAPAGWNAAAAAAVPGFVAVVDDSGLTWGAGRGLGIVAATPGALDRIEAALDVRWRMPAADATDVAAAIDVDARLARGRLSNTVLSDRPAEGRWDVDLRLDLPPAAHAPIEPRAAVARFGEAGALEVWTGSQDVFYVRDVLVRVTGLSRERITVHGRRIGGAFGGKTVSTVEQEAALLARAARRPVKVQWGRADEFARAFHRPPVGHRIRARVADGRLTDWHHAFVSSHVLFTAAVVPPWMQRLTDAFVGDGGVARGSKPPYLVPRARVEFDLVRLPIHTGPWRGLGAGPNALAIESAMDEAARAAGADPVAFRLAHLGDARLAATLRRAAAMAGWGEPVPARPGLRVGRGVACGTYKEMSHAAVVAEVAVDDAGTVRVTGLWCAHDCGRVINPDQVRAQCEGNLVWGIGMVLTDRLPVADGVPAATGFADAPIPTNAEVPDIVVDLMPSDAPPTGAGETAIVAAPGAIANAIRAATGVRPTRFPVDPAAFRRP